MNNKQYWYTAPLRVLILLATKPAFLCIVLIGLVTTFKTLNKESINTVDRPLSSTVIWYDSIDYGFITLEPKILTIATTLSILVISFER